MDLTEIKSGNGQKSNRIVLKDLSKIQKELFMSGGVIAAGVGIGSGLFSLYSMKEPEIIPETISNLSENTESVEKLIGESESSQSGDLAFYSEMPVASQVQNEVSFAEAFQVARSEVGAGGWFIWKEKVYNSYYKEEWESLSSEEKNAYLATLKVEEMEPEKSSNVEPTLASTDSEIVSDEKSNQEHIQNSVEENEVAENLINDTGVGNSEHQVSFIADSIEQINIEVNNPPVEVINPPLEFELPEDSLIFEIPAEDIGTLDSIVIDATEYNLLDERSEKLESMAPIELKNLGDNAILENIGLETNRTNIVTEYPWGEPIIKLEHPSEGIVSDEKMDMKNEAISGNETLHSELKEYPWGEQMVNTENISFAHDIKVIDEGELASANMNELHNQANVVDEYPWGESMVKITDLQTAHENNLNETDDATELNNPILDVDNAVDFQTTE